MQRAAAVEVEEGVKVLGAAAPGVVRMWVVQTAIGVAAAVGAAGQSCSTQPAP